MCKITDRKYNICRRTELLSVSQSKQMASNFHKRLLCKFMYQTGKKPPNEKGGQGNAIFIEINFFCWLLRSGLKD